MEEVWIPQAKEVQLLKTLVNKMYTLNVLEARMNNVNDETFYGAGVYIVLLQACRVGKVDVVEHFLHRHSRLFEIDSLFAYSTVVCNTSPVRWATILETFFEPCSQDLSKLTAGYRQDTLLHIAVAYGQEEVAHVLLKHGASVVALNSDGKSPLDMAVTNSELKQLLERYTPQS